MDKNANTDAESKSQSSELESVSPNIGERTPQYPPYQVKDSAKGAATHDKFIFYLPSMPRNIALDPIRWENRVRIADISRAILPDHSGIITANKAVISSAHFRQTLIPLGALTAYYDNIPDIYFLNPGGAARMAKSYNASALFTTPGWGAQIVLVPDLLMDSPLFISSPSQFGSLTHAVNGIKEIERPMCYATPAGLFVFQSHHINVSFFPKSVPLEPLAILWLSALLYDRPNLSVTVFVRQHHGTFAASVGVVFPMGLAQRGTEEEMTSMLLTPKTSERVPHQFQITYFSDLSWKFAPHGRLGIGITLTPSTSTLPDGGYYPSNATHCTIADVFSPFHRSALVSVSRSFRRKTASGTPIIVAPVESQDKFITVPPDPMYLIDLD